MKTDKERIIEYLKKNGKTAFSVLARALDLHYYKTQILITELEREGLVKLSERGRYSYIEVKK